MKTLPRSSRKNTEKSVTKEKWERGVKRENIFLGLKNNNFPFFQSSPFSFITLSWDGVYPDSSIGVVSVAMKFFLTGH